MLHTVTIRVLALAACAWLPVCDAATAAAGAATVRPRLRLEPLDLAIEHDPVLRLTPELATQPLSDPQQRAALAALWRRIQGGPDLAVQDAQRLQALQRELEAARQRTRSDAAAAAQLRARVEEAQASRTFARWLAAGLGVVLALLLAWLALRWYRLHQVERVGRWFEAQGSAPPSQAVDIPVDEPHAASTGPAPFAPAPAVVPPAVVPPADEFQASRGGSLRMVGVQELIDVHDKADFFLSIGEPEQAVGLLEAHVRGQVETGALAWLDLLELYHGLGKREAFERLRAEFRQRFTAQVPEFGHFDQPTPSLENYSRALSRIVALWPSQKVLDVIDESIFRKPGLPGAEPFSLEAYRELVLLYHVARDLASPQPEGDDDPTRPARSDTMLQPLNALDAADATQADRDRLMVPPASPHLGVDIDLDEPASGLAPLDFDFSTYDEAEPGRGKRR
jgi:hypothetical protein